MSHPVVPVGRFRKEHTISLYRTFTVPMEKTEIGRVTDVGRQTKSTSPVIISGGMRWSPNHLYERSALKITPLGGMIHRQKSPSEYAILSGGIISLAGGDSIPARLWTMPFASADGAAGAIPTNLKNRVITELLNKVGNRQWSMMEDLAEAHQAVNLVADTTSSLCRALIAFRRGRVNDFIAAIGGKRAKRDIRKGFSNRWLEYQYGWLPLVNSVYDAVGVAEKGLKRPHLIRATRRIDPYETFDFNSNSFGSGTGASPTRTVTGKGFSSAQAFAYYRLKSEFLTSLSQLGLINPAEVAWALTPYSFVVDWVLPIQNMLQTLTDTLGLTFVDGCITYRVYGDCEITYDNASGLSSASQWPLVKATPVYRVQQFGMRRSVLKSSDMKAGLYVKNPFSSTHVANALALLHQLKR